MQSPLPVTDTGSRWSLPDSEFNRWWASLHALDRDEYVFAHEGDSRGARMVCAMDYLLNIEERPQTADLILNAYCIAAKIDFETRKKDPDVQADAKAWWGDVGVQRLLQKCKDRSRWAAFERVRTMVLGAIEDTFNDYRNETDPKARQAYRAQAMEYGLRYVKAEGEAARRNESKKLQEMLAKSLERGHQRRIADTNSPSLASLPAFTKMAIEQFGGEAARVFRAALAESEEKA